MLTMSSKNLEIVDFYSNDFKQWCPAFVFHHVHNAHGVCILYKQNNVPMIEHINMHNNPRIRAPYTHSIRIHRQCAHIGHYISIKPIYYYDSVQNKDFILFSTIHPMTELKKYDIETDTFVSIGRYPHHLFHPFQHGHHIQNGTKYYMFGGRYNAFGVLDLQTLDLHIEKGHNLHKIIHPLSTIIHDNLHIFSDNGLHFKYNISQSSLEKLNSFGIDHSPLSTITLVHIEHMKRVMFFGDDCSHKIWYFDYGSNANQSVFDWQTYPLTMPHDSLSKCNRFCVFSAYDTMIIAVYYFGESQDIFCLDLIENTWYESDKKYNCLSRFTHRVDDTLHVIKTRVNTLHFISNKYHFTTDLIDLIPGPLKRVYAKRHGLCVTGYLRAIEGESVCPKCLSDLIYIFYNNMC
eukprot:44367_1